MRRFCVFHFGRSGSTILEQSLQRLGFNTGGEILTDAGALGQVVDPVERLSQHLIDYPEIQFFELKPLNFGPSSPTFSSRLRRAGEVLASEKVGVVKLQRRNPLARALSSLRANKSGVYHVTMTSPSSTDTLFSVPLKSFSDADSGLMNLKLSDYLDKIEAVESEIFETLTDRYEATLTYEDDLLSNPMKGAYELCKALSLKTSASDGSNVRPLIIRNTSVWETIRNSEVLNKFFDDHPEYLRFKPPAD